MSGTIARYGFRYQDIYLLIRIFSYLKECRLAELEEKEKPVEITFGIESPLMRKSENSDWDVLVLQGKVYEIIEVKSGAVSKDDRRRFWLRLRESLINNIDEKDKVKPKLVIDPDNPPAALKAWRALSEEENLDYFNTIKIPEEEVERVNSKEDLIKEALYWLSFIKIKKAKDDDGKNVAIDLGETLPLSVAKELLVKFKIEECPGKKIEGNLEEYIQLLTSFPKPDLVRRQLEGWLSEHATKEDEKLRLFNVTDIIKEIDLLKLFLDIDPDIVREACRLRNKLKPNCLDRWKNQVKTAGGLEILSLDEVQPELCFYENNQDNSTVILGDAGQGKTYALYQIYNNLNNTEKFELLPLLVEDIEIFITNEETEKLQKAFEYLDNISKLYSKKLIVFIDSSRQCSENIIIKLAAALSLSSQSSNFSSLFTYRKADWNSSKKLRDTLSSWDKFELKNWKNALIDRELAKFSVNRDISKGLRQLISNPFYLDIFIKTFGNGKIIPQDLQTHYGLFKVFWKKKVLCDDMLTRNLLLQEISHALTSITVYTLSNTEFSNDIEHFLSVGLIIRANAWGGFVFRHPLLRDFAIGQWLLTNEDFNIIRDKLVKVQFSFVRYGGHKALIEAICEPEISPYSSNHLSLKDYIRKINNSKDCNNIMLETADIMGSIIPPAEMDFREIGNELSPDFVTRLIRAARVNNNIHWFKVFCKWPEQVEWVEQQNWIGKDALRALFEYLERSISIIKQEEHENLLTVAKIIRKWTSAHKFQEDLFKYNKWLLSNIVKTIIKLLPDNKSIKWLEEEVEVMTWRTQNSILKALPEIGDKIPESEEGLSSKLGEIYRKAIALTIDEEGCKTLPVDFLKQDLYYFFDDSLIPFYEDLSNKITYLIDSHKKTFLPVILDILEALAYLHQDFNAFFGAQYIILNNNYGYIIYDMPGIYWNISYDNNTQEKELDIKLKNELHKRLKIWLKENPDWFIRFAAPALEKSPLVTIKTIILQLYLEEKKGEFLELIAKKILLDRKLYQIDEVYQWFFPVLKRLWENFTEQEKKRFFGICRDIINIKFIDTYSIYSDYISSYILENKFLLEIMKNEQRLLYKSIYGDLATLLCQVEFDELPEDLRSLVEFLKEININSFVDFRDSGKIIFQGKINDEGDELDEKLVGEWVLADEKKALIYDLYRKKRKIDKYLCNDEELRQFRDILLKILPFIFDITEQIKENPWVLQSISTFFNRRNNINNFSELIFIEDINIIYIAEYALSIFKSSPLPQISNNDFDDECSHFSYPYDSWTYSLFLIDEIFISLAIRDREDLFDELFNVIKEAFEIKNSLAQCIIFKILRPWHWLRRDNNRIDLLKEIILAENITKQALMRCFFIINKMSDSNINEILRSLIAKKYIEDSEIFAKELGKLIGFRALIKFVDTNRRSNCQKLVDEMLIDLNKYPLLESSKNKINFLMGLVFKLKETAKDNFKHTDLALDYGRWLKSIWNYIITLEEVNQDRYVFILWIMYWMDKIKLYKIKITTIKDINSKISNDNKKFLIEYLQEHKIISERKLKNILKNNDTIIEVCKFLVECGKEELKPVYFWWKEISSLLKKVSASGPKQEVFNLVTCLQNSLPKFIIPANEILEILELIIERIKSLDEDLNIRTPEKHEYAPWKSIASKAVLTLYTVCNVKR